MPIIKRAGSRIMELQTNEPSWLAISLATLAVLVLGGLVVRFGCCVFSKSSRKAVRAHPIIHVSLLVASLLTICCLLFWNVFSKWWRRPGKESRILIRESGSLRYEG